MIVPANRLLFWLTALLPFAALGGLVPSAAGVCAALFAALLAAAAADAALALARRRGVAVSLPGVVRLSVDRPGAIPVILRRAGTARFTTLRIGLPLPPQIRSERETLDVRLPEQTEASTVDWPCVPQARGCFRVERCHFEVPSPLGFWRARGANACRAELRVYPALGRERRRLAAFFLRRGSLGLRAHRTVGQGRDFEKLREYLPGDSYDDVHWKATAKRGRPVTKLFQIERTQEVYVMVDASRLSGRPAGGEPVLERYLASALALGLAAERQGDLFGVAVFDRVVRRFLRARRGKAHYDACRDALFTVNAEMASPDFGELFSFARLRLRRRSLLLILTDLDDPLLAESFLEKVDLVCRQHVVLVFMARPAEASPLFSAPDAADLDDVYRRLGGHMAWRTLREVSKALERRGVRLALVGPDNLSAEMVAQYLNVKARQLL
jgi:uncharacterized protein (DUF58 family)